MSDSELVAAALGGDESAFQKLMERYVPLVEGYVRGKTQYPLEAEDVMQEVTIGAYRQLDNLKNTACFGPWLLKIARHKVSDLYRRKQRERLIVRPGSELNESALKVADPAWGPAQKVEASDLLSVLHDSVGRLDDKLRIVVHLRLWEKLTLREVAQRLDLKESTVRMRYHRGIKRLRKILQKQEISSSGNA